ncbi:MAG: hypothetical protein ABR551_14050 [Gemmatimonadales bacterium]
MLTTPTSPRRPLLGLAAAAVVVLAACGDSTGPDDDHREPAGLRASAGSTLLVSVNAAREVTGSFTLTAGQSSGAVTLSFLSDNGTPITPDADEYLRIEIDGTATASATQNPGGAFTFTLNGLVAGTTTMRLSLMHGTFPGGHADYVSPNISVVVTP